MQGGGSRTTIHTVQSVPSPAEARCAHPKISAPTASVLAKPCGEPMHEGGRASWALHTSIRSSPNGDKLYENVDPTTSSNLRRRVIPMKTTSHVNGLPPTREIDEDGCIYIKPEALIFPRHRPQAKGQKPIIIGAEKMRPYDEIDPHATVPTPPPSSEEEESDEDDIMGTLPNRPLVDDED